MKLNLGDVITVTKDNETDKWLIVLVPDEEDQYAEPDDVLYHAISLSDFHSHLGCELSLDDLLNAINFANYKIIKIEPFKNEFR